MSGAKPRLAIISTYDDLCGIAAYTRALVPQLEPFFDIQVIDLDLRRLRSPVRRIQKIADRQIQDVAKALAGFDFVNIQLEYGTLGMTPRQILRRFAWLAKAAPALSVTFHTIVRPRRFNLKETVQQILQGGFGSALRTTGRYFEEKRFSRVYGLLKRLQAVKPVRLIVHTRTDARFIQDAFGLSQVYDHPLAFHSAQGAARIRSRASRAQFMALEGLDRKTKLIGTFGFLSSYKGIETVIRAIKLLPADHHLLIFGGVHPLSITEYRPIDPYTKVLLGLAQQSGERIHFMGAMDDEDFVSGMAICDAVVLPYIETGQTSSGSISQAVELGCRVIAARNHTFTEFGLYHPECVEYFDIGNYMELAERLRSRPLYDVAARPISHDTGTNAALYAAVHSRPER